jgi:putative acyl-CoA dehydrogenase
MSPLLKLFTGKEVLKVLSECLEGFGGMGFIEGTMLPTMFRDAQVLSIWEGTTNVLCSDFVRAILKK